MSAAVKGSCPRTLGSLPTIELSNKDKSHFVAFADHLGDSDHSSGK
jgi:hypothetical protein